MINLDKITEAYSQVCSSWKEVSYDSASKVSMFTGEGTIINFDKVKQAYTTDLGHSEDGYKSCDALTEKNDVSVLVEFKNGKFHPKEVKEKIPDSLLILCDIADKHISDTREELEFVVVYNPEKKPVTKEERNEHVQESAARETIRNTLTFKSNGEMRRWGFGKYAGVYFKDVHTYTAEEFANYLKNKC